VKLFNAAGFVILNGSLADEAANTVNHGGHRGHGVTG